VLVNEETDLGCGSTIFNSICYYLYYIAF